MTSFSISKLHSAIVGAILAIASASSAADTVAVTEYLQDGNGPASGTNGNPNDEYVELYNYGSAPVVMTGWKLKDDDTDSMTMPSGTTINAHDFLIIARHKPTFEAMWLKGVADSRVIQEPTNFPLGDNDDEIVLYNASNAVVWRVAYPDPGTAKITGAATFYTGTDFTVTNQGTKASPINRAGNDALTGTLGYEGEEYTADPYVYSGGGNVGSPLRGNYPGANNPAAQPTSFNVNAALQGSYLNPGVRGLANADQSLDRHDNSDQTATIPTVQYLTNSSMRGVSGGLNADIYDWTNRQGMPKPTTLEFLRFARDANAELYITANIRGLVEPDPDQPGKRRYYTTDTLTLANLAADWVRYCNHIVQTYHQGDTITDSRDASILNSLTWSSSYVNEFGTADLHTTLPAVAEAPLKKVKYWEIGNEPLVSLANAYSTTNAFTFSGTAGNSTMADYVNRYITITNAMLAEDPTIKVGPCIVNARIGNNQTILDLLLQSGARVDFISYHPYGSMGDYQFPLAALSSSTPGAASFQQGYLSGVYREQYNFLQDIKTLVALRRPSQVNTMEYAATENDVSDFTTNNTYQEGTMAHALGCVESVLSWGRLGLSAAHYWIWILANSTVRDDDNNRFAVTMAFEKMRDKLGDRLLGSFDANDKVHAYVVGSSTSSTLTVWAMNFADSGTLPLSLSLSNALPAANVKIYQECLQAITGTTTLASVNLGTQMPFGPLRQVNWTAPTLLTGADPANLNLSLPAATLTVLTIYSYPPTSAGDWQLLQ